MVSAAFVGNVYYPIFAATVTPPPPLGPDAYDAINSAQKAIAIMVKVRDQLPNTAAREAFIKQLGDSANFNGLSLEKKIESARTALASKVLTSFGTAGGSGTAKITEADIVKFFTSNTYADGGLKQQLMYPNNADVSKVISAGYTGPNGYFYEVLNAEMKIATQDNQNNQYQPEKITGTPEQRVANYSPWHNTTFTGSYLASGDTSLYLYAGQNPKITVMDPEALSYALAKNPQAAIAPDVVVKYDESAGPAASQLNQMYNSTKMLTADQAQLLSNTLKSYYDASFDSIPKIDNSSVVRAQQVAMAELGKSGLDGAITKFVGALMPGASSILRQKIISAMGSSESIAPILFTTTDTSSIIEIFGGVGVNRPDALTTEALPAAVAGGGATAKPPESDPPFNQLQTPSMLGYAPVIQQLIWLKDNKKVSAEVVKSAIAALAANYPDEVPIIQKLIDSDPTLAGALPNIVKLRNDGQSHPIFNWADMSSSTSLSIDQLTGNAVFTAQILNPKGGLAGYIKFDPVTKLYDAQLSMDYAGKSVQFSSDPRNQDVYVTVTNADRSALTKYGPLELMSASISSSGSVGGTFRYQDRVFSYNPNSQAFEVPIAIYSNGTVKPFSTGGKYLDKSGKQITGKGVISIDTKGNLTGSYELLNQTDSKGVNQAGNLYFDRSGNIGFVYTASQTTGTTTRSIGSIAFDIKGNVNGTVNLGKALNFKSDVLLGFDKNGLTGLGWNTGYSLLGSGASELGDLAVLARGTAAESARIAANLGTEAAARTAATDAATAASYTSQAAQQQLLKTLTTVTPWIDLKSGAFSLNTPVLSLGQINGKGDIGFKWPGGSLKLCSIGITKCESRPDVPTVPIADKDGNVDFSAVQCQHSYKQLFQTVKIYNDAKVEGAEAQAARSALIFKSFNDIYGRNPGQAEYIDWYFIMDNQRGTGGYTDWECNKIELLKLNIEKTLKASKEAQCFASSGGASATATATATATKNTKKTSKASDCPAPPSDLMPSDPLNQTTTTTTETATDTNNVVDEFLNGVNEAAAEDPLWNGSGWTGLGESGDISNAQISLTKGYNAFFVPSNMTSVDASVLGIDKYVLFAFNGDGLKQWYSSEKSALPKYLQPGTGYYIYSRSDNVKVPLKEVTGATTGVQVHQGWNLLANATGQAAKLSELTYSVVKTAECKTVDCTESKTLRNLYSAGRAYSKIYVVSDDKATDAAKAFQILTVDSANADSITIPAGKIFWFYLK